MSRQIVLIDLSSIAYPVWHVSQAEPDLGVVSARIVERVRALATGHPHVAICCDSGRSFRHEIDPAYKGQRPEREAALIHQIQIACETLGAEGYPVWRAKGFEADDLIATAVRRVLETPGDTALVVSADKDILQLVCDRVQVKSVRDGSVLNADAVVAKFGVTPGQVRDYLCLVGDASDNVKGAKGIGPKKAAELLGKFGSLAGIYEALGAPVQSGLTPSLVTSLREFDAVRGTTERLIALRADAEIPFHEVLDERQARDQSVQMFAEATDMDATIDTPQDSPAPPETAAAQEPAAPTALAMREPDVLAPTPAEWERQLDPRSLRDAKILAQDMFQSRLFSAYGTPQGVLSTVMMGRELGLPAMASLRSIHVIEGRHALSAQAMVALVLRSGLAEFFDPIEFDDTKATFETKRKGARNPVRLTYTLEMAVKAGLVKEKSNWAKNPMAMCMARSQAMLCRLVYPDLLAGLYTPEELHDIRSEVA